jgi:probable HAF family extracellular repeat protein
MNAKQHLGHLKLALIVGTLALPLVTQAGQPLAKAHTRYKLTDLGTLGGPQYYQDFSGIPARLLNEQGTVIGGMDTAVTDPFCFNADCFVSHAFQWRKGELSDLGTLAFNAIMNFSQAFWINERGLSVGISTDGGLDQFGNPIFKAVLWKNGQINDLGTLGGNSSMAQAINNRNQVVGMALNTVPDPVGIWFDFPFPFGTQQRAVLWQNGTIQDLGTLGGPDAWASGLNDAGQVIGQSYTTDTTVSPVTGARPIEVFLWKNGKMVSLGSLGGTMGIPNKINNQGQIVGWMNLPGDEAFHPFVWERGTLTDLGTFGGSTGQATWLNDRGDVVGVADFPGDVFHNAFLWRKGVMTDLGNLGQTSFAHGINSRGQIVGASRVSFVTGEVRAFLWEKGGPMIDLNTLVPADSSLHLAFAHSINERGEIAGYGFLPNGDQHPFLLIPVGEE